MAYNAINILKLCVLLECRSLTYSITFDIWIFKVNLSQLLKLNKTYPFFSTIETQIT